MYKTNTQHKNNVGKFIFDPKCWGISRKYRKTIVNVLVSCSKLFVGKTDCEPYVIKFPVRRSTKRVCKKETNGCHISKVQASSHTHTNARVHTHTPPTEHLVQHQKKKKGGGVVTCSMKIEAKKKQKKGGRCCWFVVVSRHFIQRGACKTSIYQV